MQANTFAARAGRWSAQHRKKAIWGWLAFVAIAFVIGGALGVKQPTNQDDYVGQSGRADKLVNDHFPKQDDESVLVQAPKGGTALGPDVRSAVNDTMRAGSAKPGVRDVQSPYKPGNEDQISQDGRSVLVQFKIDGNDDTTERLVEPVIASVHRVQSAHPDVFVGQFGGASANKAISDNDDKDMHKIELLSLPVTLLILVVTSSCSWGWRSASTTRCSTSAASARSGLAARATSTPSTRRQPPPAAPSSSPASR